MSFGQRLKELRHDFDLSQAVLADRAGCSVEMLRKVESDVRRPSRELAMRLAEVFELPTDARTDFVRLARGMARSTVPHLPEPPTRLIGREQELVALRQLVQGTDARLVTLLGPPGVGKTRLALQLAANLDHEFRDGAVLVPLASIREAPRAVEAIAETIGMRGGGGRALDDALVEHVRSRQLLLVLDNFEQVLAARTIVAAMLTAAPRLRIVVTSRQPLSIYGEHWFEVPPLGVREPVRARGAQSSPAETLFLERARAIRPGYARDPRDLAVVAELCRRLDGLPLAIELAASRARTGSPAGLLDQLGHRLKLLSSGPVDLTPRQRSMRGALDWSFELLADDERQAFAACSVFAGGFTVEAASAVVPGHDMAALVESLAEKSLLQVTEVAETTRFAMLEIVREYAAEHLEHVDELRAAHAAYFAALGGRAEAELTGPRQVEWLARLGADHDNFRAALEWSLAHDRADLAGQMCAGLWRFWRERGFFYEGRRWLAAAVARGDAMTDRVRAAVLNGAGVLALLQSDFGVAIDHLTRARDLCAEVGDTAGLALALSHLGIVAHNTGEMERAQGLFEQSLQLARDLGDRSGEASALLNVGMIDLNQGRPGAARERFATSAKLFRDAGDVRGLAQALSNLGWVNQELRDYGRATALLTESLELAQQLSAARLRANNLSSLALVAWYTHDYPRASDCFLESLGAFSDLGDRRGVAESLEGLAGVLGAQSRAREAATLLGCASSLRQAVRAPLLVSDSARHATAMETAREQLDEASWNAAWAEGQSIPPEELIARILDGPLFGM